MTIRKRLDAQEEARNATDAPSVSIVAEEGDGHVATENWPGRQVIRDVPDLPAYLDALKDTETVVIIDDIPKP